MGIPSLHLPSVTIVKTSATHLSFYSIHCGVDWVPALLSLVSLTTEEINFFVLSSLMHLQHHQSQIPNQFGVKVDHTHHGAITKQVASHRP